MMMLLFIIICNVMICSYKITTKPSSSVYKFNGNFFWKIGKSYNFYKGKIKKIIFNDYPICLYRDANDKIIATSDICIHRGASLSRGKIIKNNCLQCPYHGWEYNNGLVHDIPGSPFLKKNFGVPQFLIKEFNNDVFLCPTYDVNSESGIKPINNNIYIPPEANDNSFSRIQGMLHVKRTNTLITENVLDMMHISYVHSFGNQISPIPFDISYEDLSDIAGKTTFHYAAGQNSMSSIFGKAKYVKVENEFHLPDTTVTRVFAGDQMIKTIITHCYPVGRNESILHFDLYRNFLTSELFDPLFYKQMDITLNEDVAILNGIYDNYIKGFMNTKFDVTQLKYREKIKKKFITEKNYDNESNHTKKSNEQEKNDELKINNTNEENEENK